MKQYLDLLQDVKDNGRFRADRTGVGAYGVFGRQLRCDLSKGFPLLTTKKVFTRGIIAELLWFLSGDTNEHTLRDQKVGIWKEWSPKGHALTLGERRLEYVRRGVLTEKLKPHTTHEDLDEAGIPRHAEGDGALGRIYGAQWRAWRSVRPVDYRKATLQVVEGAVEVFDISAEGKSYRLLHDRAVVSPYLRDEEALRAWLSDIVALGQVVVVDQITNLIRDLKNNPNSRRHIVTAWNPGELDQMALPPCHCLFQFYTEALTEDERKRLWEVKMGRAFLSEYVPELYAKRENWDVAFDANMAADHIPKYRLSCQLYQRSCDIFLGVPFNIASYSLLTMMVAQCVNMAPGDFVHTYGDLHLYSNHLEQAAEQLSREPRALPTMRINPEVKDIFAFKVEDFTLEGYDPHPAIKAEVAV